MSRFSGGLERLIVLLIGLVLIAVGGGAIVWYQGWFDVVPDQLTASAALDQTATDWWPWAVGGAGVVLIIVGLAWLGSHARRNTVQRLRLSGSGRSGKLSVDSSTLLDAVTGELADAAGVRSKSGRIFRERRVLTVEVKAGLDRGADLNEVADAAERASVRLRSLLGPETEARCRVILTAGGRSSTASRVQ